VAASSFPRNLEPAEAFDADVSVRTNIEFVHVAIWVEARHVGNAILRSARGDRFRHPWLDEVGGSRRTSLTRKSHSCPCSGPPLGGRALIQIARLGRGIVAVSDHRTLGERPPTRGAQQRETVGEQPDRAPGIQQYLPCQGVQSPDLDRLIYFVGLPFQYAFASPLIGGVGRDARYVVDRIGTAVREDALARRRMPSASRPSSGAD
jgi:hypothetical protein